MTSHRDTSRARVHRRCKNLTAVRAWTVLPNGYSLDRLPAVVETFKSHGEDGARHPKSRLIRTMRTPHPRADSKVDA